MSWLQKAWVKYLLAAVGAVYIVVFAGYLINLGYRKMQPTGASELAVHPERAEEILARQRAEELREQLRLNEDQANRLTELFQSQGMMMGRPPGGPGDEDFRARREAFQSAIAQILTAEQQEQFREMRGGFGGPGGGRGPGGGPGQWMSPERLQSLRERMTPEQQERFDRRVKEWEERRQRGPGGGFGGGPGGGRGPGGGPPGGPPGGMGRP